MLHLIGQMKRVATIVAALCAFAFAGVAAAAEMPGGPRLAFTEWWVKKPMATKIASVDPHGKLRRGLVGGSIQPVPFWGPTFSPDGNALAFAGFPVGRGGLEDPGEDEGPPRIYLVSPLGSAPREVPGTRGGSRPVFSPDGAFLAFSRSKLITHFDPKDPLDFHFYSSTTAWVVPLAGGPARRLTPWSNGLENEPASFSPDGKALLMRRDGQPGSLPEIVSLDLSSNATRVVARNAEDPAFSPDGSRIALVSYRDRLTVQGADGPVSIPELYVVDADGSHPRRLTRTLEEGESQPSWDPSGSRLAFVRFPGGGGLGFANVLMQANADGSCVKRILGRPGRYGANGPGLYGPTWQPGPGREAGPISC
jgi:Tol biopolymer transport system component